ncbi:MAG: alpha/beta fold hydrolase [Acidobacteria bacterium]|nr:alpha/beta fold hydrolase [Acidobacteriota bacterium]
MRTALAVLVLLLAAPARAEQRDVTFPAADGFALQGTFYPAPKGGPGVLLLHQCNADRRSYDQLAVMLNNAGYNVLSFDFRGFGGSRGGQYTEFASQRERIVGQMPGDVDGALKFLTAQNTVIARALGVVGGSCGVNQAIQASRRHPDIRTLVLLSGGTNADGEAHIKASRQIPIFGVASEEDGNAPASIRKIVGLSAHPDSRVQMLKNAGHAAEMLARQEDLGADIVIWFRANLPVAGYGLPPALR